MNGSFFPKLALLLSLSFFCAPTLRAQADEDKPDFSGEKLTGNWEGLRDDLYQKGFDFDLSYTLNSWRNFTGGNGRGNRVDDNLNLIMAVDGEKALHSKGTSFKLYLLNNNGGRINDLAATNGGIDNMEVTTHAFKLYEAWVQQSFMDDRISILAGLHDLNSEFYVTDTSGLFINPTYGIGTEMAATGDNGPSIFPTTSLGIRLALKPNESTYLMGAIYDGVSGDPNNQRGTHVRFKDKDGALLVTEGGIQDEKIGHFGIGAWEYTAKRPDQLNAAEMKHSKGVYFLADRSFYDDDARDVSAFARYGFTAGDVEQFHDNLSFGVVLSGFIPSRPDGQLGLAYTTVKQ